MGSYWDIEALTTYIARLKTCVTVCAVCRLTCERCEHRIKMMRHRCKIDHSRLIFTTLMVVILTPMTSDSARSWRLRTNPASYGPYPSDRQRYRQTDSDINQPDDDYYYIEDEGSCDIEVACRTDTDEALPPTSMKLPIRGCLLYTSPSPRD